MTDNTPENPRTLWNNNSPDQQLYNELRDKLVPMFGAAMSPQGELLRAIGRIYYDRFNNGFGNGPFETEFDTLREHCPELSLHCSDDSWQVFEREFRRTDKGEKVLPRGPWAGDAAMEKIASAAIHVAAAMQAQQPAPRFCGLDALVGALNAGDAEATKFASGLIRQLPEDALVTAVAKRAKMERAQSAAAILPVTRPAP